MRAGMQQAPLGSSDCQGAAIHLVRVQACTACWLAHAAASRPGRPLPMTWEWGQVRQPCHLVIMPAIPGRAPHGAIHHLLSVLTPLWVVDMISHEALQQRVER